MGANHVAKMVGVGRLSRARACLKRAHILQELGLIVYFWFAGLIPVISKSKTNQKKYSAQESGKEPIHRKIMI